MKTKSLLRHMLAGMTVLFITLFSPPVQAQNSTFEMAMGEFLITPQNSGDLIQAFKNYYSEQGVFGSTYCNASGKVKYDFSTQTLALEDATSR